MPDPDDALADALVEVSELVVAMGDPREALAARGKAADANEETTELLKQII